MRTAQQAGGVAGWGGDLLVLTHLCPRSGTAHSANNTARPPSSCCCGACPTCSLCSSSASPSAVSSGVTRSTTWWSSLFGEPMGPGDRGGAWGPGRPPGHLGTASLLPLRHRNLDLSKFCIGQKEEQLPSYDLYAVINHYGGMIGGHYTACARLPSDRSSQRSDVGEGTCNQLDRW